MKIINVYKLKSTNNYLYEKIKNNDINLPVCIQSDIQTAGKGRKKRNWISKKGGLYFSIANRMNDSQKVMGYPLFIAVYLHKYLLNEFQLSKKYLKIKWPNDIYYKDKKLSGILTQNISKGNDFKIISGVGLNIYNELNIKTATSLKNILSANSFDLKKILIRFIDYFENNLFDKKEVINYINKNLYKKNSFLKLTYLNSKNSYKILKVNNDFSLKVKDKNNNKKNIILGEIL